MDFDFKITTWERITVPEEHEQKILEKIKSGEITTSNDIFDLFEDSQMNILSEVEEQMSVEENGGCSTIEVFDGTKRIYQNGK
jgi:hypothetical protein